MESRIIYEIDEIKYTECNGEIIVHISDLQYKAIQFVIDVLDKLNFPYKQELAQSDEYENAFEYRFVADDEAGGKEYSIDDICALEDTLCIGLKQNNILNY